METALKAAMKASAILLSAGESLRMGRPKGLLDYFGEPWIQVQIKKLLQCGVEKIVVVLGKDASLFQAALPLLKNTHMKWGTAEGGQVDSQILTTINTHPELGPYSSLVAGISCVLPLALPVFIMPIDVPCPPEEVFTSLFNELKGNAQVCVPQYRGQGGHPVLLGSNFLHKLMFVPTHHAEARLDVQIRKLQVEHFSGVPVIHNEVVMNLNDESKWLEFVKRKA